MFLWLAISVPVAYGADPDDNPSYDRGAGPGLSGPKSKDAPGLPAFPRSENLARLDADEIDSDYEYWIDVPSVTLDVDGVVRYTLVMRSPKGVPSVFFEGFRCDARSYKTYAYGTRQGRFAPFPEPQWNPISLERERRARAYLWLLYNRYFCSFDGQRHSLADIRKLLAGKTTATNEGWRTLWDK